MGDWLATLTLVTAVGCGLVGGVFFAFSRFVMRALGGLPAATGIEAMQAINRSAVRPPLMAALIAPAAGSVALVGSAAVGRGGEARWLLAGGGAAYLIGAVGLTVAYHVPRNVVLASVEPGGVDGVGVWRRYLDEWTRWNSVRAAASLIASAMLTLALR